jgi:hypothetical protein
LRTKLSEGVNYMQVSAEIRFSIKDNHKDFEKWFCASEAHKDIQAGGGNERTNQYFKDVRQSDLGRVARRQVGEGN